MKYPKIWLCTTNSIHRSFYCRYDILDISLRCLIIYLEKGFSYALVNAHIERWIGRWGTRDSDAQYIAYSYPKAKLNLQVVCPVLTDEAMAIR